MDKAGQNAQTAIALVEGNTPLAVLAVADGIRPESREAVQRLHEQKVEVIMLTGDAQGSS